MTMRISRTLIVGAGGTGGQLIPPLVRLLNHHPATAMAGVHHPVIVIDGDDFEDHNQQRQHIGPAQIGRNKADWTAEFCASQGLSIESCPQYLDAALLRQLLRKDASPVLLVAAVDNDATRKLCIDELLKTNRDFLFISPGNAGAEDPAMAVKGQVLWFGQQGDEAIGLNPALVFPNIEEPQDAAPRYGSCAADAPSSPQLIAANALAAAYTLAVLQNLLDGAMHTTVSSCFFNGRTFATSAS